MATMFLPGQGMVDLDAFRAHQAAYEYDDRLSFKQHENGQWCVFIAMPRGSDPPELPILGFGHEIPHPDDLKKKLFQNDSLRHGGELLGLMERHNAELRKQQEAPFHEATGEAAERMEHVIRNMGMTNYKTSFRKHTHSAKRKPKR